jgi:hypothetical protein
MALAALPLPAVWMYSLCESAQKGIFWEQSACKDVFVTNIVTTNRNYPHNTL